MFGSSTEWRWRCKLLRLSVTWFSIFFLYLKLEHHRLDSISPRGYFSWASKPTLISQVLSFSTLLKLMRQSRGSANLSTLLSIDSSIVSGSGSGLKWLENLHLLLIVGWWRGGNFCSNLEHFHRYSGCIHAWELPLRRVWSISWHILQWIRQGDGEPST